MPFLRAINLEVDCKTFTIKFWNGTIVQRVPVTPGSARTYVYEVSAMSMAKLVRQQGIIAYFGLFRDTNNMQNSIFASIKASGNPLTAVPPAYQSFL